MAEKQAKRKVDANLPRRVAVTIMVHRDQRSPIWAGVPRMRRRGL